MNLTPSNPQPLVVLQAFQASVSHYAHLDFFSFRNGSLHVTQQTDSSFVRLHDLVLSHSEWHSGDARRWVMVTKNFTKFLHDFALTAHASGPCSLAVMHIMHIFQTLGNATIDQHRASWESRRIQAFHVSVWVRSPKTFLPRKKLYKCNTNEEISKVFAGSTCPLVHDRLKKLFHLSMWQQGGCWTKTTMISKSLWIDHDLLRMVKTLVMI